MKPESADAATRKPSRAPRLVDSNRYAEPQKRKTPATGARMPMIVGSQSVFTVTANTRARCITGS
jgi:hypothetical protein